MRNILGYISCMMSGAKIANMQISCNSNNNKKLCIFKIPDLAKLLQKLMNRR